MQSEKFRVSGPALIITAAILWAIDGIIRRNLYSLSPISIIFFEHFIGALILLPFLINYGKTTQMTKREWAIIILVSFLSGLLGTLFFTTALLKTSFISFSVVFLIQKLQPLFAISTARIFLKEQFSRKYILWAVLALAAAYFVTFPLGIVNFKTGGGTLMAALFALLAAVAWGNGTTFSKMVLSGQNSTYVTALRFSLTSVMAFVAIFVLGAWATFRLPNTHELLLFILIALSTGMVALLVYYRGLKLTPVRVSTILELTFPVVAILIDVLLYKSVLHWSQYIGAVVLLFAMYQISVLQNKHEI